MKQKKLYTFLAAALLTNNVWAGQSVNQQKAKLESIKESIQSLQKNISLSQIEKQKIQNDLQNTEQSIGETAKKLHGTVAKLQNQQKLLNQTRAKNRYYQEVLLEQEQLLEQHIRAAYMLGRQQYLKMILNQEDTTKMSRDIQYYHYLTEARLQIIQNIQQTLMRLTETTQMVLQQTQRLQVIKGEQQSESNKLVNAKHARSQLLSTINASISTKQQQLQRLQQDKANLENVLQKLQQHSYFQAAPGGNFAAAQGKLPWPVPPNRLLQNFAAPIADGRLHSTGVLIQGATGTPVHAVFAGKVVFAHWLRGFGLLVIVQHGPSYMTLYAHAESLYVKQGDNVNPGDIIATIGDSGGLQQSALYFEIRHKDQPMNPLAWLRH